MEEKHSFLKKLLIAFALILFILFCASQKQAHALIYDGTDYSSYSNTGGGTVVGAKSLAGQPNNGQIAFNFTGSKTTPVDSDLIGYRFNLFAIDWIGLQNQICQGSNSNGSMVWSCTNPYDPPSSDKFDLYANIVLNNGTDGNVEYPCWLTSEFQNTFICTNDRKSNVVGINVYLKYYAPNTSSFQYRLEMTGLRFKLNNDTTPVVNSQQQIQDSLTGSDTTGASTNGINDINSSASSVNTELNSTVGTNDFVSIFTTFFSQIENSTCTPITLPIPYTNENLVLPCLGTEFQNRIPLLWTLYVTIITGVIVFRFWRFYIDMFKHLLDPYSTGLHGVSDIAGGGK